MSQLLLFLPSTLITVCAMWRWGLAGSPLPSAVPLTLCVSACPSRAALSVEGQHGASSQHGAQGYVSQQVAPSLPWFLPLCNGSSPQDCRQNERQGCQRILGRPDTAMGSVHSRSQPMAKCSGKCCLASGWPQWAPEEVSMNQRPCGCLLQARE